MHMFQPLMTVDVGKHKRGWQQNIDNVEQTVSVISKWEANCQSQGSRSEVTAALYTFSPSLYLQTVEI